MRACKWSGVAAEGGRSGKDVSSASLIRHDEALCSRVDFELIHAQFTDTGRGTIARLSDECICMSTPIGHDRDPMSRSGRQGARLQVRLSVLNS